MTRRLATASKSPPSGSAAWASASASARPPNGRKPSRVIRAAVERGVTLFDTAEVYGPFVNEELVGEALQPVRDRVRIAPSSASRSPTKASWSGSTAGRSTFARSSKLRLKRLRTDRIDLLYQHRVDPARADRGRRRRGEGLSQGRQGPAFRPVGGGRRDHPQGPCRAAGHGHPGSTIRCGRASPSGRNSPLCEELGIGLVAWSPLGQGFLTGKITPRHDIRRPNDFRKDFPRFTPEALEGQLQAWSTS